MIYNKITYGIFDIDSVVYEATYNAEDLDEAIDNFWSKYKDVVYNMEVRYGSVKMINVGFCRHNYRATIFDTYKANRKDSIKPEFLAPLIEYVKDNLDVVTRSFVETDDIVAKLMLQYGKDKAVIISIDKDYMQFEGTIYNYRKREFIKVSEEEAYFNFWSQMIIGDSSDNVKGVKGLGKSWCEKNLQGLSEYGMIRVVFKAFAKKYKAKGREAFIKTYFQLKLNIL